MTLDAIVLDVDPDAAVPAAVKRWSAARPSPATATEQRAWSFSRLPPRRGNIGFAPPRSPSSSSSGTGTDDADDAGDADESLRSLCDAAEMERLRARFDDIMRWNRMAEALLHLEQQDGGSLLPAEASSWFRLCSILDTWQTQFAVTDAATNETANLVWANFSWVLVVDARGHLVLWRADRLPETAWRLHLLHVQASITLAHMLVWLTHRGITVDWDVIQMLVETSNSNV